MQISSIRHQTGPGKIRKTGVILVKSGIGIFIIWWLFRTGKIDFTVLLTPGSNEFRLSIWYLGILLKPAVILLFAYRWHKLLLWKNIRIRFSSSLRLAAIGNFFTVVLPGSMGGDVVKTYGLVRNMDSKRMNAVTATIIDRILGVCSLLIVVAAASAAFLLFSKKYLIPQPGYLHLIEWIFAGSSVMLLFTLLLIFAMQSKRTYLLLGSLLGRLPAYRYVSPALGSLHSTTISSKRIACLILLSIAGHILNIMVIMCIAQAVGDPLRPGAHFLLSAVGISGNLVPLTPGGIGIAEGIFAYVYAAAGSGNGALIGLMSRMFNYMVFIGLGFPLYIFMRTHVEVTP